MVGERCDSGLHQGPNESSAEGQGGLTDEELLRRFLESGQTTAEGAFAALMRRHGPMVLGVCRHVLGRHHDAEDAFQATFLMLARKAGSIRARNVLGRWLYEVAYRTAMRARMSAVQRQAHEKQGALKTAVATNDQGRGGEELRPILHEELRRLPDKYRTPIVLCYLEGKTNEEAARLLQWPVGTVKGRLSRARDLLRTRLVRRGVSLTLALLIVALSKNEGFAETISDDLLSEPSRLAVALKSVKPVPAGTLAPGVAELMKRAPRVSISGRRASVTMLLLLVIIVALTSVFSSITDGQRIDQGTGGSSICYWTMWWQRTFGAAPSSPACHAAEVPTPSEH